MLKGTQTEVKLSELLDKVCEQVNPSELDFYSPVKDFTIEESVIEILTESVTVEIQVNE